MFSLKSALVATLFFISSASWAQASLDVTPNFVRETIPGVTTTAAYLTISNNSEQAVKLVAASSDISPQIELHQHIMANGMMKMRQVPAIEIKAHSQVTLEPMGYHLMMFQLKHPVKQGDNVNLMLLFDNKQKLTVTLPVQRQAMMHH